MKLSNWALVGANNNFGFFSSDLKAKSDFIIWGNVQERPPFPNGTFISSTAIAEFSETVAITNSGLIYELSDINSDYVKFLEAIQNKIPVLKNWHFEGSPEKKVVSGTLYTTDSSKKIHATITSSNTSENLYTLSTGETIYIDWLSIPNEHRASWPDKIYNSLIKYSHVPAKIPF